MRFYVYVMFRHTGEPFYVGKGSGYRFDDHFRPSQLKRRSHKNSIIKQVTAILGDVPRLKIRENISESDANTIERLLICAIGRRDLGLGPLINMTNGGEGAANPSDERRAQMRLSSAEINARPGVRERRAASLKTTLSDPDQRAKRRATMSSESVRVKQSAAQKVAWARPGMHERASVAQRMRSADPQYRLAMRRTAIVAQNRPEVLAKRAATDALPETKARRSLACTARELRRKLLSAERDAAIVRLYRDGASALRIAALYGLGTLAVYRIAREHGASRKCLRDAKTGRIISRS